MNTVEIPWNLFLKSLHEESVHVATGVEFARTTNFFNRLLQQLNQTDDSNNQMLMYARRRNFPPYSLRNNL